VRPYNQTDGALQSSHSVSGISRMKQKYNSVQFFVLEWSSRTQGFQVGRQPIASTGAATEKALSVTKRRNSFREAA